jgi:NTE family protein
VDRLLGRWSLDSSPAYLVFDLMTRLLSPYHLNPLDLNPLRCILSSSIDFHRIGHSSIKLFITATIAHRAWTHFPQRRDLCGRAAGFRCLPTMFQAIEIDGEYYWDGGYAGNPTITPFVRESDAHDTMLVQTNRRERTDILRTAHDVLNRLKRDLVQFAAHDGIADDRAASAGC